MENSRSRKRYGTFSKKILKISLKVTELFLKRYRRFREKILNIS
jgi:hypothetical protein